MLKIRNFFRRHWNKVIAVICAVAISVTTVFSTFICVQASSIKFDELVSEIVALTPLQPVIDFANVIKDVYLFFFEDAVMADREIQRAKILAAWKTFTDNSTLTEDQFADYWQQCIDELGLADDRLLERLLQAKG